MKPFVIVLMSAFAIITSQDNTGTPDSIQVEDLRLVDSHGTLRMKLGLLEADQEFYGIQTVGKGPTFSAGSSPTAAVLQLRNSKGVVRLTGVVTNNNALQFLITDNDGNAVLTISPDDSGAIFQLRSQTGAPCVSLGHTQDDRGVVRLSNPDGNSKSLSAD